MGLCGHPHVQAPGGPRCENAVMLKHPLTPAEGTALQGPGCNSTLGGTPVGLPQTLRPPGLRRQVTEADWPLAGCVSGQQWGWEARGLLPALPRPAAKAHSHGQRRLRQHQARWALGGHGRQHRPQRGAARNGAAHDSPWREGLRGAGQTLEHVGFAKLLNGSKTLNLCFHVFKSMWTDLYTLRTKTFHVLPLGTKGFKNKSVLPLSVATARGVPMEVARAAARPHRALPTGWSRGPGPALSPHYLPGSPVRVTQVCRGILEAAAEAGLPGAGGRAEPGRVQAGSWTWAEEARAGWLCYSGWDTRCQGRSEPKGKTRDKTQLPRRSVLGGSWEGNGPHTHPQPRAAPHRAGDTLGRGRHPGCTRATGSGRTRPVLPLSGSDEHQGTSGCWARPAAGSAPRGGHRN